MPSSAEASAHPGSGRGFRPFRPHASPVSRLPAVVCSLLGFLLGACAGSTTASSSDTQGIDPRVLRNVTEELADIPGSFSFLVQRHGVLVAENYFHGFTADSLHDVRSVTKSVVGMLVGIAIRDGWIGSVEDPIGTYLGTVVDSIRPEVAQIPLRRFLTMSSGLDWHELDGGTSYSEWWQAEDMVQHVVDLPMVQGPRDRFLYNTGASHLLSVVLTQATGQPTLDYAREVLFQPMGFSGSSWLQENRGYYTGGMGLRITARDMVKMGQMFLDGGSFQGLQLIPASWVATSVSPLLSTDGVSSFGQSYGYLWWVGNRGGRSYYYANGYGGQFILVVPALELVVVTQNSWRGTTWDEAGAQWLQVIRLLVDELLPGVT